MNPIPCCNAEPTRPLVVEPDMRPSYASISWFAVILAMAGALTVFLSTSPYGIGVSPDSVNYIFCARQLATGEGFQSLNHSGAYTASYRSPTLHYLKRHPLDGQIYTNGPDALYIFNGQSARTSPRLDAAGETWCRTRAMDGDARRYLIWFNRVNWRAYLATPRQLNADYGLIPLVNFSDGTIYLVACIE